MGHLRRQKVKWKGVSSMGSNDSDFAERKSLSHIKFALTGHEGMCNSILIHKDSDQNIDLEVTSESMPEGKFTKLFHETVRTSLGAIQEGQEEGTEHRHIKQEKDDDEDSESSVCSSELQELDHGIRNRAHKANIATRAKQRHRNKMILRDISTPVPEDEFPEPKSVSTSVLFEKKDG